MARPIVASGTGRSAHLAHRCGTWLVACAATVPRWRATWKSPMADRLMLTAEGPKAVRPAIRRMAPEPVDQPMRLSDGSRSTGCAISRRLRRIVQRDNRRVRRFATPRRKLSPWQDTTVTAPSPNSLRALTRTDRRPARYRSPLRRRPAAGESIRFVGNGGIGTGERLKERPRRTSVVALAERMHPRIGPAS